MVPHQWCLYSPLDMIVILVDMSLNMVRPIMWSCSQSIHPNKLYCILGGLGAWRFLSCFRWCTQVFSWLKGDSWGYRAFDSMVGYWQIGTTDKIAAIDDENQWLRATDQECFEIAWCLQIEWQDSIYERGMSREISWLSKSPDLISLISPPEKKNVALWLPLGV